MFGSLLILLAMPLLDTSRIRGSQFRPLMRFSFWLFVVNFLILIWIGNSHVVEPYILIGQLSTAFYFGWFLVIVPAVGIIENTLMDIAIKDTTTSPSSAKTPPQHGSFSIRPFTSLGTKAGYSTDAKSYQNFLEDEEDSIPNSPNHPWVLAAKSQWEAAVLSYDPGNQKGTPEEFRSVANGFFQAEGHVGASFRDDHGSQPYVIVDQCQLFTPESLEFFVRLHHTLNKVGRIAFKVSANNNVMMSFRIKGWPSFFNQCVPFYTMLYGLKFQAIAKLTRIHSIRQLLLVQPEMTDILKMELICLVYSLTGRASHRSLPIANKTSNLGIAPNVPYPVLSYDDNLTPPNMLFILGFFLGDGSLFPMMHWRASKPLVEIKSQMTLVQTSIPTNRPFMQLMHDVLIQNGMHCRILDDGMVNGKDVTSLITITGVRNHLMRISMHGNPSVNDNFIPFLAENHHFLFWKLSQYNLIVCCKMFISNGLHRTYIGLKALAILIYSVPNKRKTPLAEVFTLLDENLAYKNRSKASREQDITGVK